MWTNVPVLYKLGAAAGLCQGKGKLSPLPYITHKRPNGATWICATGLVAQILSDQNLYKLPQNEVGFGISAGSQPYLPLPGCPPTFMLLLPQNSWNSFSKREIAATLLYSPTIPASTIGPPPNCSSLWEHMLNVTPIKAHTKCGLHQPHS